MTATNVVGILPAAPPVSFRSVAKPFPASVDWQGGVTYRPVGCPAPHAVADCVTDPLDDADDPDDVVTQWPFTLIQENVCQEGVLNDERESADEAETSARLEAITDAQLAAELISGAIRVLNPQDPTPVSLSSAATDATPGPGPTTPALAMASLLQARGALTPVGSVLHVPGFMAPFVLRDHLATQVGSRYVGPLGMDVLADIGNDGTVGPGGDAPDADSVWFYISGPVRYGLSPITFNPEKRAQRRWDARTNRYVFWAERRALVDVEPCGVFAAQVLIPTK